MDSDDKVERSRNDVGKTASNEDFAAASRLQKWWRRVHILLRIIDETERRLMDETADMHIDASYLMDDASSQEIAPNLHEMERLLLDETPDMCIEESLPMDDAPSQNKSADDVEYELKKPKFEVTHGTQTKEIDMRRWLNDSNLPQSVADALMVLGVCQVSDVKMVVETLPEVLSGFCMLDRVKLERAVAALNTV